MDVLEQAKILGRVLVDSDEFKAYADAEAKYNADEEAQRLTKEYDKSCELHYNELKEEGLAPSDMVKIRRKITEEYTKVSAHPVIKDYLEKKKAAEKLLSNVNSIIKFYVTGEEQTGGCCSGSCSTCGGCG